jgi:2-succinyl-5-enolpyruvyl-6-hydroxy-3-cyclohexene-1-carboxylate synthase
VNPATALATTLADELIRCGLREAVLAPGSRSAPLALALHDRDQIGDLRLHVRIDERSAAFLALGLAKASRSPVAVLCTSGTAAAHLHAAVIEADEAGVPLLVLTADRPPELRGTGANQSIDQLKLYGSAVRWFCEMGVPEAGAAMTGYWRSAACRAWGLASGSAGGPPGPVHLNLPFRDPLIPDPAGVPDQADHAGGAGGVDRAGGAGGVDRAGGAGGVDRAGGAGGVDQAGGAGGVDQARPGAAAWTRFQAIAELAWTERGLVVCGDGDYDAGSLVELAETARWPVLAEPSSGARYGPNALSAYQYLLAQPGFVAAHRPEVIVSAGRPGLSRGQLALLRGVPGSHARHVVLRQGPGRWADPARTATDVAAAVRLSARPGSAGPGSAGPGSAGPQSVGLVAGGLAGANGSAWLEDWRAADAAARTVVDAVLDSGSSLSEPRLARDLAAALPAGALLWVASSLPIRDLDEQMAPRADIRVLASRGASGIDGLVSSAIGAALAHQANSGGPAFALLGDLSLLHDAPGLFTGPAAALPDLCLIVVNNDGGGIFSMLEQATLTAPFERLFGTPHGADVGQLARAAGIGYQRVESAADLPAALRGTGLRLIEVQTDRAAGAALRSALRTAVTERSAVRMPS